MKRKNNNDEITIKCNRLEFWDKFTTYFWTILGFLAVILGVSFVILKTAQIIDWGWFLVLLPFYGYVGLIGAIALVVASIVFIEDAIHDCKRKNKQKH